VSIEPGSLDEVRSERLLLRRPCEEDRADILRMHEDQDVMATLGGVRSEAESDWMFDRLCAHWRAHEFGYWIARESGSGRFAGRAGLRHLVVAGHPEVELGYGFMSDLWGRGVATEIASACVDVAFTALGLEELVCFTATTNNLSQNVMEKVGFRYEKNFVYANIEHRLCRLDVVRWKEGREGREGQGREGREQ
jgi:ribosomal-protein-alanine N-acetyltransferase